MHNVTIKQTDQPATDSKLDWYDVELPIFYPHEVLAYLFDEVGLKIPDSALREYWTRAKEAGIGWASSAQEPFHVPLKFFADDAAVNDQGDKVFAFIISCPLYRPKNSRTSKWPVAVVSLRKSVGWFTIRPILSQLVYSLNHAFDNPTTKTGVRFQVTEIGMDWKALRECFQMRSHWNKGDLMCHMCRMGNKEYASLPATLDWRSTSDFIAEILEGPHVTPLILLRQFDVSCISWCLLHNVNLGLLWTINGGCLADLIEMNAFGNLAVVGFTVCLKAAYKDFKEWQAATRIRCSQRQFTYKMLFKPAHGAYLATKGFNARCISAYLADKTKSMLDAADSPSDELQLMTHTLSL